MSPSVLELTRAEDLMNRDVVALGPRDTIQDAIALMAEHHVSGLPVVGADNRCQGVLSASDILSFVENEQREAEENLEANGQWFNTESLCWESVLLSPAAMDEYGSTPIEDVMTSLVITVPLEMPAAEVAQEMDSNSVHRVFVIDEKRRLHGVISSFDFVRMAADSNE